MVLANGYIDPNLKSSTYPSSQTWTANLVNHRLSVLEWKVEDSILFRGKGLQVAAFNFTVILEQVLLWILNQHLVKYYLEDLKIIWFFVIGPKK